MKCNKYRLIISLTLLASFVLWTIALCHIDVRPIGPNHSAVGFSTLNVLIHNMTGANFSLYIITDWLGLIPLGVCIGFGTLGLSQWIRRKRLRNVDPSILGLGLFYIVVMAVYGIFEVLVINYRPVLIDGILEASYPSSTTILVICVMATAIIPFRKQIKHYFMRYSINVISSLFIILMVFLRILSGVHWLSDIIGGILLSSGLVMLYASVNFDEMG